MLTPRILYAIASAIGSVLLLELLYLLLRRSGRSPRSRAAFHAWVALVGLAIGLNVGGADGRTWRLVTSAAAVFTAMVLFSLFDTLVIQRPWAPARGPLLPKLARDVLRVGVFTTAVLTTATVIYQYPLEALLVSSTVLSAVIGLALQDVLKNVFAGMGLELERPFSRGDWLLVDGQPMQVLETSWRSVRLRNNEGVDFFEPNANLSTSRVTNYGSGRRPVAIELEVGLPYDAPPDQVKEALEAAAAAAPLAATSPGPRAFVREFGDSAVVYRVRAWTRAVSGLAQFRDGVASRIWYELRRRDLTVPFPIRTLQVASRRTEAEAREARQATARRLLGSLDLFSELDDSALDRLAQLAQARRYDDGEVLVREGDHGDSLFVIRSGRVKVSKSGSSLGTSTLALASLKPGDFFGEMSLLTGEPRSATVTADGASEVLVLSRDELAPLLHERPRLAEVLSAAVAAREAKTLETVERRRDQQRSTREIQVEASLLSRIRSFFKLTNG